jgi:SAM-dependent methyltransferase
VDRGRYQYGESAHFYDAFAPYRDRPDISFYVEEAVRLGGPVLELGCGTGRVLIPTARAGLCITGLDASQGMLTRCRETLEGEPDAVRERVTLQCGDMRAFQFDGVFRLITIPFRPFQHLEDVPDQLACLGCVHRHLADDGRLVFDLFNPWLEHLVDLSKQEEAPDGPPMQMPDGRRVQRFARIVSQDLFRQIRYVELAYVVTYPDGRTERRADRFPMRYTFRYEMEHLLVRSGFAVESVYSGFDRAAFGSVYPGELVFVARKS